MKFPVRPRVTLVVFALAAGIGCSDESSSSVDSGMLPTVGDSRDGAVADGSAPDLGTVARPVDAAQVDAALVDAAPADAGSCIPKPPGVIGLWRGEGNANDSKGNNNLVAVGGVVGYAPGKIGQAFSMPKGSGYLELPTHVADFELTTAYTLEAWVNVTAWGNRIIDHITENVPNGYLLDTYPNTVRAFSGDITVSGTPALTPAQLNTWVHLAAAFDGAAKTLTVYVNGVERGKATVKSPAVTSPNHKLRIGASSNGTYRINGLVDEVTIYNRALSAAEILAVATGDGKCPE